MICRPLWSVLNELGRAISRVHVRASAADADGATDTLLRHVVTIVDAESGALVTYGAHSAQVISVHGQPDDGGDARLPLVAERALPSGVVRIRGGNGLPKDATADHETLDRWGMRSALIVGLGTWPNRTLLALGSVAPRWPRRAPTEAAVRALGDLVGNALGRIRAEHAALHHRRELMHVARVSTLGELAASLAHELNQPLGAILASAEAASLFLDAVPPSVDRVRDIVRRIATEDGRAYQIITRMRALFRRSPVERVPLNVGDVIADVFHLVEHEASSRHVVLRVDVTPGLPAVLGDRVQCQQVLLNLILNAFDAVGRVKGQPAGGVLVTASRADERHVEIAVRDGGSGIASEALPHVFDPFYTTKLNGLGMGLPICRSIVEAHGGTIACRNNPDRGVTFAFTIPSVPETR